MQHPPSASDDEQQSTAEETEAGSPSAGDSVETADSTAAPVRPRSQRPRYEKWARQQLPDADLIAVSDGENPTVSVTVAEGPGSQKLSHGQGDAAWIGDLIKRWAHVLGGLAKVRIDVESAAFANSVTITFRSTVEEVELARAAIAEALEETDEEVRRERLAAAAPATLVAARMLDDFVEQSKEDPVQAAIAYGGEVTDAWATLTKQLGEDDVSVKITSSRRRAQPITLSSGEARNIDQALGEHHEVRASVITVFGVLTLADADKSIVNLKLDRESAQPKVVKSKRVLRCEYPTAIGDQIRDEGLWRLHVKARISVAVPIRADGEAALGDHEYKLISVEKRYPS